MKRIWRNDKGMSPIIEWVIIVAVIAVAVGIGYSHIGQTYSKNLQNFAASQSTNGNGGGGGNNTVTLNVQIAGPQEGYIGQALQYSVTASNGQAPYQYHWTALQQDSSSAIISGQGTDTITVKFTSPQSNPNTYTIAVDVIDQAGDTGSASYPVDIRQAEPLSVNINSPGTYGNTDTPYTFSADAQGGVPPYSYTWSTQNITGPADEATATYEWHNPGTYTVSCTVTDAVGATITAQAQIQINGQMSVILYGQDSGQANYPYNISAWVKNGTAPFVYMWNYTQYIQTQDPEKRAAVDYIFPSPAVYTIRLTVRDATGQTATGTKTITINAPVTVTIAGPSTASPNTPVTYYAQVQGGKPPYYYFWYCDDGNGNNLIENNRASQATVEFPQQKQYVVQVTVYDSTWYNYAKATKTVTVTNPIRVVVLGPTTANPGEVHTYTVRVYGGTPPYTYYWTTSYDYWAKIISGQGTSSVQVEFPHRIDDNVDIYCTVTDSKSNKGTGSIGVTNGYSPGPSPTPYYYHNTP